jgi:hypothetical protein
MQYRNYRTLYLNYPMQYRNYLMQAPYVLTHHQMLPCVAPECSCFKGALLQ